MMFAKRQRNTRPGRRARTTRGFTLLEIMIVVAILGIILAIAGPTWVRQRLLAQQRVCQENLVKIDGSKEQWALENNKEIGSVPGWSDLTSSDNSGYLKRQVDCPGGGVYTIGTIGTDASCSIVAPNDHNHKE